MKLREEIEPKIIQIEKICPQISRLLRGAEESCRVFVLTLAIKRY